MSATTPGSSDSLAFAVGEIAILTGTDWPGDEGMECEIVRLPTGSFYIDAEGDEIEADEYVILQDEEEWICPPECLRKKRPPRGCDKLVSWDDVPYFNPTEVAA